MSDNNHVELNKDALDIVDSWLDSSKAESTPKEQPHFEKRAQRLGLGAKFVPHKRVRKYVDGSHLARRSWKCVEKESTARKTKETRTKTREQGLVLRV